MTELKIVARTPETVDFVKGLEELQSDSTIKRQALVIEYSNDATTWLVGDDEGIEILHAEDNSLIRKIECKGVRAAAFSRQAKFVLTFERPTKNAEGHFEPNLKLWRLSDGACLLELKQKELDRDHWPSIQFTVDDGHCVHQVTNTLHVYDLEQGCSAGPCLKFPVKGISKFSLSPKAVMTDAKSMVVMTYVPEIKGTPGYLALHRIQECSQGTSPTPLARKSFFRANSVRFLWNSQGSAVLIIAAADVDATNQSYYGEQKLFFFSSDGSKDMAVQMPKEGPIHDVQWSPRGDFFVTVAGFMPAKSTLFTVNCVPKFDLGSGPFSMIRWNPFGRFFALAGFGNLPGDLSFYDKKADAKCKLMGSTRASNGVSLQWSPCGRYVLTATTAPRLRVDNGFQVFRYNGTLINQKQYPTLYEALWKPAKEGTFEDRPQSPRAQGAAGPAPVQTAVQQPVKSKGYIPPHLRSKGVSSAPKASFSLARDQADTGGKIRPGSMTSRSPGGNLPPGAEPAGANSKAALKNAKRRAKKKQAANQTS